MKTYTLTPRAGHPNGRPFHMIGFRAAMAEAKSIAAREHCAVTVRNEADCHTWNVAFRVRSTRNGARYSVEVTR